MNVYQWLGLMITVPAALILLTICVRSAMLMSLREASSLRGKLAVAAVALMALATVDYGLGIASLPVLGLAYTLVVFIAGCGVLYSMVVGVTFLFRQRFRGIGGQLVIFAVLTIWWFVLFDELSAGFH